LWPKAQSWRPAYPGKPRVPLDLLTDHEPCDRSAGHRPGQLASNRIHRAEAVLGAPVHGKVVDDLFNPNGVVARMPPVARLATTPLGLGSLGDGYPR